jgi:hypothetical protein
MEWFGIDGQQYCLKNGTMNAQKAKPVHRRYHAKRTSLRTQVADSENMRLLIKKINKKLL